MTVCLDPLELLSPPVGPRLSELRDRLMTGYPLTHAFARVEAVH